MVDMQGVIAESQRIRGILGQFLSKVHEPGGLHPEGRVRLVAGNFEILAEFICFLGNHNTN